MYTAKIVRKTYITSTHKVRTKHNMLVAKFDFYDESSSEDKKEIKGRIKQLLNEFDTSNNSVKRLYCKSLNNHHLASFYPTHIFGPKYSLGFEMETSFGSEDFEDEINLDKLNNYILTGRLETSI